MEPAPAFEPTVERDRVRALLQPVEQAARTLPWADREPWQVARQVGHDGVLLVIDLHGLSARLARDTVRRLIEAPPEVGVVWVHGRGGSRGKTPGVLVHVVREELGPLLAERGWTLDPQGARTVWIVDRTRAPTAGTAWLLVGLGVLLGVGVLITLTRPWWEG